MQSGNKTRQKHPTRNIHTASSPRVVGFHLGLVVDGGREGDRREGKVHVWGAAAASAAAVAAASFCDYIVLQRCKKALSKTTTPSVAPNWTQKTQIMELIFTCNPDSTHYTTQYTYSI